MKIFKGFIAILFAVILVLLALVWIGNSDETNNKKTQTPAIVLNEDAQINDSASGYMQLNDSEKTAYQIFCTGLDAYQEDFDISEQKISTDSLERVYKALIQDNPEYFWFDSYSYHYNSASNIVSTVHLNYNYTQEEIVTRIQQIESNADAIIAGLPIDADTYTKIKYTHDWVINQTVYDTTAADNQNICSVFIGGRSVCAGYSRAFQYLLQKMGIFCTYVTGNIAQGSHAWNLVRTETGYYYVDTTLDDFNFIDGTQVAPGAMSNTYLLATRSMMEATHIFDTSFIAWPETMSTQDNYFVREDLNFDLSISGEMSRLTNSLSDAVQAGNPVFQARFSDVSMIDSALDTIASSGIINGSSLRYLTDTDQIVLTLLIA